MFKHSFPELHLLPALLTSISTHFQIAFSFSRFGKALTSPLFESQVHNTLKFLGRLQLFCRPIMDRKTSSIGNLLRFPEYYPVFKCSPQKAFSDSESNVCSSLPAFLNNWSRLEHCTELTPALTVQRKHCSQREYAVLTSLYSYMNIEHYFNTQLLILYTW